jgi:NAD(P)H-flavin reductase
MIHNFSTRLVKKKQLTTNIFLFHFQLIEPKTIDFKAGQYLMLKINDQWRLYSICSPDFIKDSFELVVEIVERGLGSTYLNNLKTGSYVNFQGPAGVFTIKRDDRDKIFLATGTGIAPIRSMITSNFQFPISKQVSNFQSPITKHFLFWGLRTRNDVCFFDEFKKFSGENQNFKFQICLSREKDFVGLDNHYFILGHINDGLLDFFNTRMSELRITNYELLNGYDYYICGGRDVVISMVEFLQKQGIRKENIFFEKF